MVEIFALVKNNLVRLDLSIFGYIQLAAFLIAPLNGLLFDSVHQCFSKKKSLTSKQIRLKSLYVVYLISSSSMITYSLFTLTKSSTLQYVTFVLVVIAKTFAPANFS